MTTSSTLKTDKSRQLMQEAQRLLPGGVNSPVRAFKAVGGNPLFIQRGAGARIWDADGNEYLDYVGSWGPLILGHAPAVVVEAVSKAARDGTTFGAPTAREVELAALITKALPSIELVRLVNSGTEATMSALRVARAFTGRQLVVKFEGCYHGHADFLLAKAGSGVATLGLPDSAGVPPEAARSTVSVPYNDVQALEQAFTRHPGEIAAVIIEPVAGNMGVVPPGDGYLAAVRELCTRNGALLVFDEVITGFRVGYGGAQGLYGIKPDLTCLGKIIGGGLPVGAYGGRRDVMELVAPLGPVYQAGTLSGNPLAMAAGIAALTELGRPGVYQQLEDRAAQLAAGLEAAAKSAGVAATVQRVGSMLTAFFTPDPVTDYEAARRADTALYARYFWAMLERGVYLAPSQFEAAFVSLAHAQEDIARTTSAAEEALKAARG